MRAGPLRVLRFVQREDTRRAASSKTLCPIFLAILLAAGVAFSISLRITERRLPPRVLDRVTGGWLRRLGPSGLGTTLTYVGTPLNGAMADAAATFAT